jgi:CubicO group peptidase (beta-lactamase class C family)
VGGETDALFDLASVTKSLFAVSCARAGFREKTIRDVPLELMLAHRAGFPAHLPLFAPMVDGARVELAAAIESAWSSRTGPMPSPPLYSDVGYLLAGHEIAGDHVDFFIRSNLSFTSGISGDVGSARQMDMRRAVPTEHVAWRGGEVRGHVHDENAWALGGDGACGHAGLFGTVSGVLRFGAFVLERLLDNPSDLEWLVREREGGTLRAGFDGKSLEGSSAGSVLGPRSFGHLGFTGTSLWIDPDARIVVALLTNRVCPFPGSAAPGRDNTKIREARPRVHDALARLALSGT